MKKEFLAKGHRSYVYLVAVNGKKYVRKEQRKDIKAIGTVDNEAKWLKTLNRHKVGPKLFKSGKGWFICEYVKGERVLDFMEDAASGKAVNVLTNVLKQCRVLDRLKVTKEEMHNPYKHIIVGRAVKMIDFERCHHSLKPKNVTQFLQFIASSKLSRLLKNKGVDYDKKKLVGLSKKYKKSYSEKDFNAILSYIRACSACRGRT